MIPHEVEQRSIEWREKRLGIPTASHFGEIVKADGEPTTGEGRKTYLCRLVSERILGWPAEDEFPHGRQPRWMQHGMEHEHEAREWFSSIQGVKLSQAGFYTTDDKLLGASPDCLIQGRREGVEIKCPAPWTHVSYLLYGPGKQYKQQVQGQMLVCELEKVYFFSHWPEPDLPDYLKLTMRDEDYIKKMRRCLYEFLDELHEATERVRQLRRESNA